MKDVSDLSSLIDKQTLLMNWKGQSEYAKVTIHKNKHLIFPREGIRIYSAYSKDFNDNRFEGVYWSFSYNAQKRRVERKRKTPYSS